MGEGGASFATSSFAKQLATSAQRRFSSSSHFQRNVGETLWTRLLWAVDKIQQLRSSKMMKILVSGSSSRKEKKNNLKKTMTHPNASMAARIKDDAHADVPTNKWHIR